MKALRLHAAHDLRLHEDAPPVPSQGEALLRTTAVGLCGSDLHWLNEGTTGDGEIAQPFVLGHEFAGIVEGGILEGERVAVDPQVSCEVCEFCLEGNPNLFPNHIFAGQAPQDGALREFMAWPTRNLIPVPVGFTDEDAAMLEPLGVAIHAVDLGKLRPRMNVGVYGCGPIGLLVAQLVKLAGARSIIASDRLPHRLEAAIASGSTETFVSNRGEENDEIIAKTSGRGLDVTFEMAGENDAVETAVETCKPGGRVVIGGIPSTNRIAFRASAARRKGLTIKLVRRMKHAYPRAIQLVEHGKVDVRSLVTHRFPLDAFEEAFRIAEAREGIKVIINP